MDRNRVERSLDGPVLPSDFGSRNSARPAGCMSRVARVGEPSKVSQEKLSRFHLSVT